MSKRKAEDVQPLDGGELPQEKKQKTGDEEEAEKEYADQITICYEPANLDKDDNWESYKASYYTLRAQCSHGWFESKEIPNPPKMIITTEIPYGSLWCFVDFAVKEHYGKNVVSVNNGHCVNFQTKDGGTCKANYGPAYNALRALPVAIYMGHESLTHYLLGFVIRALDETDAFTRDDNKLWSDDMNAPSAIEAILNITQQLNSTSERHAELISCLNESKEARRLVRSPALSVRFGKVFRRMQLADWNNAPSEVTKTWECLRCRRFIALWARWEYAREILSAEHDIDWAARRAEKIAAFKTCDDHSRKD